MSSTTSRIYHRFRGLTNLQDLYIWDNQITDISALSGMTKLNNLGLRNNQIRDLSPLSSLTNLPGVYLNGNLITDLSPLSGLSYLGFLRLDNNLITDISPLLGMTNLDYLDLRDNPLSASSINEHIPVLQDRGVTVDFDPTPSTITITITDDPTPVTIRDAKLRTAIAAALGKASGATITQGEMTTLFALEASDAGIRNVTGLEFATNLTKLVFGRQHGLDRLGAERLDGAFRA